MCIIVIVALSASSQDVIPSFTFLLCLPLLVCPLMALLVPDFLGVNFPSHLNWVRKMLKFNGYMLMSNMWDNIFYKRSLHSEQRMPTYNDNSGVSKKNWTLTTVKDITSPKREIHNLSCRSVFPSLIVLRSKKLMIHESICPRHKQVKYNAGHHFARDLLKQYPLYRQIGSR